MTRFSSKKTYQQTKIWQDFHWNSISQTKHDKAFTEDSISQTKYDTRLSPKTAYLKRNMPRFLLKQHIPNEIWQDFHKTYL